MKRYAFDGDCLEPDEHGDWVRFEEVEVLLAELNLLRSEKMRAGTDALIGDLVRRKLTSGNDVAVERCTVLASELVHL